MMRVGATWLLPCHSEASLGYWHTWGPDWTALGRLSV